MPSNAIRKLSYYKNNTIVMISNRHVHIAADIPGFYNFTKNLYKQKCKYVDRHFHGFNNKDGPKNWCTWHSVP